MKLQRRCRGIISSLQKAHQHLQGRTIAPIIHLVLHVNNLEVERYAFSLHLCSALVGCNRARQRGDEPCVQRWTGMEKHTVSRGI